MIWRYFFLGVGLSGATSRCLHRTWPLKFPDTIPPTLYTDNASVHPVLKDASTNRLCMLLRDRRIDRRYPLTKASDHLVLKASSCRVSVLIQTERRIDRRCPHSDRRIIRCYGFRCSSSVTRSTHLEIGPLVHPTVPRVLPSEPTRQTIESTLAIWVPSVHPMVSFSFFFSRLQLGSLLQLNILNILIMPLLSLQIYTKSSNLL
jgi:hypothetical protein